MAKADDGATATAPPHEEAARLLSPRDSLSSSDDLDTHPQGLTIQTGLPLPTHTPSRTPSSSGLPSRVASPALVSSPRGPRTPNRVRFDLTPNVAEAPRDYRVSAEGIEIYDYATHRDGGGSEDDERDSDFGDEDVEGGGGDTRRPLLTDIEAPAVALANGPWGDDDDGVHEWAEEERRRPKSGLRSAFMNMANSIIGAGIIGQPYALRQAGLLSGIVLLVLLTLAVDWTVRLIVVNSKLSGANSFQGTVQHCFGKAGLIAISVAQWAFAFGGMVAFAVIVGDTIPHVLLAIWPNLRDVAVLGLLADRRAVIVVFVMGISFPLTLYRDIAKVGLLRGGLLLGEC
ncbi:hypothetical protein IMZ48_02910 [Candidatus Bathyarchaeota archaeon]|nr:hypothetical protein [Candidatus Bathyarchaeota archaeon]